MMKWLVITGASSGVGAATAVYLAKQRPDYALILVGRNNARLSATRQAVEAVSHVSPVVCLAVDLNDKKQFDKLLCEAVPEGDCIIGLITSHGIFEPDDKADLIMRSNYESVVSTFNAVQKFMTGDELPRVVFVTTAHPEHQAEGFRTYYESKARIEAFAKQLAIAHRGKLLVNIVAPGTIDTPLFERGSVLGAAAYQLTPEAMWTEFCKCLYIKRLLQPEEVARAIDYAISQENMPFNYMRLDLGQGLVLEEAQPDGFLLSE